MASSGALYKKQIEEEVEKVPLEFLPSLLKLLQVFRESVTLPAAEDTFRTAWAEAQAGLTMPVEDLWDGIDAE